MVVAVKECKGYETELTRMLPNMLLRIPDTLDSQAR